MIDMDFVGCPTGTTGSVAITTGTDYTKYFGHPSYYKYYVIKQYKTEKTNRTLRTRTGFKTKDEAREFLQKDWEAVLSTKLASIENILKDEVCMKNTFHEDDFAVICNHYGNRTFWWIESKEKEKEMPTKLTGETFSLTGTLCMKPMLPKIKEVIFNNPATIVLWEDGTKTVVKVKKREKYDKWVGLAMCHMKKYYGEKFHKTFKDWCEKNE